MLALIALAVWLGDGGPVIFRQMRAGRRNTQFELLKFRLMRNNNSGPAITAASDDRITPVGRILRKYKIDELPQLWNVVRGDMSIVGPRPEALTYVDDTDERWRVVLEDLPGLTDVATLVYRHRRGASGTCQRPGRVLSRSVIARQAEPEYSLSAVPNLDLGYPAYPDDYLLQHRSKQFRSIGTARNFAGGVGEMTGGAMRNGEFIPFNRPEIGTDELFEVAEVLRSGWLTTGERTKRFETELCAYTGARFGQAVNSCTAGLHLALAALNIGPGDEVITTPLTFCATVNVILHQGATPVLADIDDDFNISPAAIRERITPRTRAILPVHFAGLPCRMTEIWDIARDRPRRRRGCSARHWHPVSRASRRRRWRLAQRCCRLQLLRHQKPYDWRRWNDHHESGEDLYGRMRRMTLHGISRDAWNRYSENGSWFYEVVEPGFKYNLSDLQSAIGLVQLKKIEAMTARRAELAHLYNQLFEGRDDLLVPPDSHVGRHCWHLYVLRINPGGLSAIRN